MESTGDELEALYQSSRSLSVALGYRDLMTHLHSERVRDLAMAIGQACQLDARELAALKVGAAFHDIGKIGIPDHILMKPGRLDEAEWRVMMRHAEFGEKIIMATGLDGAEAVAAAILHHHEHFDGSGYPEGLRGEAIPISARIISIADSYDAMAVTRSYHHARAHDEIMAVMHSETESKFDPEIMAIFRAQIEDSPQRVP